MGRLLSISSRCLVALAVLSISVSVAAEPHVEFVEGMRARGYYDYAILYLDQLEARKDLPKEVSEVIPFERAITLLASSRLLKNPDSQAKQLDAALANLERFTKNSPNHPLAAQANTERARILLGKARVLIWQSQSPTNEGTKESLQKDARDQVKLARTVFQEAFDRYQAAWKKFPTFIPEDDRPQRRAREEAERMLMRTKLDLANCTYEEAQTYDRNSKPYKETLNKASLEFEEIHSEYRSQIAGLYARMMQGKCFEEQDDLRKALGIYDELLRHPGQSEVLRDMQAQVRQFRLICLNHEQRKDYELAIEEAQEWLKEAKSKARTQTGLGIRWELTRAQESLSQKREIDEAEKNRILRQALANAREINRYPGRFQDVSYSMIQRLLVALNREPGDPQDFDTAFGTANKMIEEIGQYRTKIEAAEAKGDKEEAENLRAEMEALLSETERLWKLSLQLATDETDKTQVNIARYRLAYTLYLRQKSYDAAVVGQFLATHYRNDDPTLALDAAYIAMAGYAQAYNKSEDSRKPINLQLMTGISQTIVDGWPKSDRANDARMTMGLVLRQSDQPVEAARWYSEVPPKSDRYGSAQLEAGQSYWNAYLNGVSAEGGPTPDELKNWQTKAMESLESGIETIAKDVPASSPAPDNLIRAKVSLAQIKILTGDDQAAIQLLTADPHSVVKAIEVPDEKKRSTSNSEIKGRTFALFTNQLLLRAYVGTKQLEKAREIRGNLEAIAGGEGGEALTAVYVELGRELQNELEQLKRVGNTARLQEVRSAFEAFLQDLFQKKDGQTYGSLIWIAETYYGLAQGSEGEQAAAEKYFGNASQTYSDILERAKQDPNFVDEQRLPGVRLRLVNCKRREGDFQTAEELITNVLEARPKILDAQMEAARVYQDWGSSDSLESDKLKIAIEGKKDGTPIWGWSQIATRLQYLIEGGKGNADYQQKYYEARYNLSKSRFDFANTLGDPDKKKSELEKAEYELVAFSRITPDLPETEWWDKFDTVYQDIQGGLGRTPIPLEKPEKVDLTPKGIGTDQIANATGTSEQPGSKKETKPSDKKEESSGSLMSTLMIAAILLVGLGLVGAFVMNGGKKKKKTVTVDDSSPPTFPIPGATPPKTAKPKPKARRPATAQGSPAKKAAAPAAEKKAPTAGQPTKSPEKKKRPAPQTPEQKKTQQSQQKPTGQKPAAQKKRPASPEGQPAAPKAKRPADPNKPKKRRPKPDA